VEHKVARKIVAQEQLIKKLEQEVATSAAAARYLETVQRRLQDDHKFAVEQMVRPQTEDIDYISMIPLFF